MIFLDPIKSPQPVTTQVKRITAETLEECKLMSQNPHLSDLTDLQLAQCALRDFRDMLDGVEWKKVSVEHFLEILVERLKKNESD